MIHTKQKIDVYHRMLVNSTHCAFRLCYLTFAFAFGIKIKGCVNWDTARFPLTTFDSFLVQFFVFFYSFMSYFSIWGQLCWEKKKKFKITKKTSFISFFYLNFLLNWTHFCTTLTSTYAVLVNICQK